MYCSSCGKKVPASAKFCADCGASIHADDSATAVVTPAPSIPAARVGNGFGIAALIIAVLSIGLGLADIGLVVDPTSPYTYVDASEIGLLFILSVTALVFGSLSKARNVPIGRWALAVAGISFVVAINAARYGA
ncbi:MAG: zinc-ribbon domain [Actinomycetota bacterium]|jgi:hypothetical protein